MNYPEKYIDKLMEIVKRAEIKDSQGEPISLNDAINEILTKIVDEYIVLSKIINTKPHDEMKTCEDHLSIIQAIADDDPQHAETIMRGHLRNGLREAIEYLQSEDYLNGRPERELALSRP